MTFEKMGLARELCAGLIHLGIQARIAEPGRMEEDITRSRIWSEFSLGLIDISEGAIQWVNVQEEEFEHGSHIFAQYGVPTPQGYWSIHNKPIHKTIWALRSLKIRSVRVKKFPLLGRVGGVRWRGEDSGLGIVSRLNGAASIQNTIMRSDDLKYADLEIRGYPEHGCWILNQNQEHSIVPSRDQWNCYREIAEVLLGATIP